MKADGMDWQALQKEVDPVKTRVISFFEENSHESFDMREIKKRLSSEHPGAIVIAVSSLIGEDILDQGADKKVALKNSPALSQEQMHYPAELFYDGFAHRLSQTKDGRVMCCICFSLCYTDELSIDETDGKRVDVCQNCKDEEDLQMKYFTPGPGHPQYKA